jgi:hypothetical protein
MNGTGMYAYERDACTARRVKPARSIISTPMGLLQAVQASNQATAAAAAAAAAEQQ